MTWYCEELPPGDVPNFGGDVSTLLVPPLKTLGHIAVCERAYRRLKGWHLRPPLPLSGKTEVIAFIKILTPEDFAEMLQGTAFYTEICGR
jgi:hypothetical protein